MAKVFISALGTGKYEVCKYGFDNTEIYEAKYVQEAAIRNFCKEWGDNDRILIFCTQKAEETHWCELFDAIKNITKAKIEKIKISDGKNEKEIWDIFNSFCECIKTEDELYIDITHGLRSIPMLIMVAVSYVNILKNAEVKNISYGAYEMKDSSNNLAPVFDLTPFYRLMRWTNATKDFINYGKTEPLMKLLPKYEQSLYNLNKVILSNNISKIKDLKNININTFNADEKFEKPFIPLIEKIKEKTKNFKQDNTENFLPATKWCIDHELYQNAYSILLEGLFSYIFEKTECSISKDMKKIISISAVVHSKSNKDALETFLLNYECKDEKKTEVKKILQKVWNIIDNTDIVGCMVKLIKERNDFMHGNFESDINKLKKSINEHYKTIKNWVEKSCL